MLEKSHFKLSVKIDSEKFQMFNRYSDRQDYPKKNRDYSTLAAPTSVQLKGKVVTPKHLLPNIFKYGKTHMNQLDPYWPMWPLACWLQTSLKT